MITHHPSSSICQHPYLSPWIASNTSASSNRLFACEDPGESEGTFQKVVWKTPQGPSPGTPILQQKPPLPPTTRRWRWLGRGGGGHHQMHWGGGWAQGGGGIFQPSLDEGQLIHLNRRTNQGGGGGGGGGGDYTSHAHPNSDTWLNFSNPEALEKNRPHPFYWYSHAVE